MLGYDLENTKSNITASENKLLMKNLVRGESVSSFREHHSKLAVLGPL